MKDDRDIEKSLELSAFITELRRLADSLEENGTFEIEIEGETIQIPGDALFSIEHEREDGREELEFQLKWGADEDEDEEDEDEEDDESSEESDA